MAQEAPSLIDVPDHELEQRRQSLSYAVIWGSAEVAPELNAVEQELGRRARARALEEKERIAKAREAAWEEVERREAQREEGEAQRKAELDEAERRSEARRLAEEEEEQRRAEEAARLAAEEARRREEEERRRAEEEARLREEARRKAEEERRRRHAQIQRLAQEQLEAAREVQAAVDELIELAATFVRREEAMFSLAVPGPAEAEPGAIAGGAPTDGDRFTQAELMLGGYLRSRLSAIPALRLRADLGVQPNGANGRRPSLEDRLRSVFGDLVEPPEQSAEGTAKSA
jgi:hypothetical protein